ncbi:hypothetical protein RclHR1_07750004 [Rhizophagus clarus]|uniref:Protein kinase domain-containing protein n=1 Tax=Rhizophagus clarus TaxID=94130 RepID=A0A2Z6SLP3_9GLOM|nr:hypothetical protein RclHR1_07750004 [Rhizophagus clarus]
MSLQDSEDNKDHLKYLKNNLTNWTSGNEQIDDFIQEMQSKIENRHDIVFEWIQYSQFVNIKEIKKNGFITLYSAIWKEGPLLKKFWSINKTKDYLINRTNKHKDQIKLYGISQNPHTKNYILVQNKYFINLISWMSGNEKIDDFIREMQLESNNSVFEWIPYNRLYKIKETDKNGFMTVYSAVWKDGPLTYNWKKSDYTRDSNENVALKCLHNSQDPIESLMNEAKKYLKNPSSCKIEIYGISQNLETNDYILVQNDFTNHINWTSGNVKIDDFIQEMQLKYNKSSFEWISYSQFYEIKETGKNNFMTVYSAIWKDGPLYEKYDYYKRYSNKNVALKFLHNSQNPIEFLINEAKKYLSNSSSKIQIYGMSQDLYTNDYILVFNWTSGNEKIDDFIQAMQLKCNNSVFEWIPYSQLSEIKEIDKDGFITVYSAIWKDSQITYDWKNSDYTRGSNKNVALKCLHNLQHDPIKSIINEAKKYLTSSSSKIQIYGISQSMDTYDYILVQNDFTNHINWTSGNIKIDDFIQEMQLNIKDRYDTIFEWIPYNQFCEIKETGRYGFITVYSAIWKYGPLYKEDKRGKYHIRDSNKKIALKSLNNSQDSFGTLIDEVNKHLLKISKVFNHKIFEIYGISQNPDTSDYILVQNNFISLINWMSGNKKIDDFIQEMQLNINGYSDIVFEWIPYNQFCEIKEVGEGGFATVYSAIWKDGPLLYLECQNGIYKRDSNKKVALKCLDDSQNRINELLNEIKAYSTKALNYNSSILKVYGISQDTNTKNYIIVLHYAEGGNFNNWLNMNENFEYFDWENKLLTLYCTANGLKEIHEKHKFHHDFHTGNILFDNISRENNNKIYISDMGLCGRVDDMKQNNIYGVMPYVAPEVLRGKPYTQSADIYSFGMIMYFVATGRQPFNDCAHDHNLALDICNGVRPEINEQEATKSYIDLMKKCWDSNPENRPTITEFKELFWTVTVRKTEIEEAENYRKSHISTLKEYRQKGSHPQTVYTSRLLNPFTKDLDSKCLDCAITD